MLKHRRDTYFLILMTSLNTVNPDRWPHIVDFSLWILFQAISCSLIKDNQLICPYVIQLPVYFIISLFITFFCERIRYHHTLNNTICILLQYIFLIKCATYH